MRVCECLSVCEGVCVSECVRLSVCMGSLVNVLTEFPALADVQLPLAKF